MGSNPITLEEAMMTIMNNLNVLLNMNFSWWALLFVGSLHWMYKQAGKRPQSCLDLFLKNLLNNFKF